MDGWVKIGTELDTKSFDAQIDEVKNQLEEIEYKLKQADMGFEVGDTSKLESQYERLSSKLTTLKTKQLEVNRGDFSKVNTSVENIGKKVDGVISKIGKWALAVFGIRTAYSLVQRAISTVSGYNDQIKTDIEYIGFALASVLEPVIKWLIQGVYTLLTYVNYLAQAWFGVNLFAKASTDAFKKATTQAEKLKKTTAGFDEMNIAGDTNSSSSLIPSFDLSSLQNEEIPTWLQWIKDNGTAIIAVISGIAGAILAMKLSSLIKDLGLIKTGLTGIQTIGIGLIIAGIILLVKSVIDYLNNPSWENFGKVITGIGIILLGLGAIIGSIPVLITAVIVLITGLLVSNWNFIKGLLVGAVNWITNKLGFLKNIFGNFGTAMISIIVAPINMILSLFNGLFNGIRQIFDGIIQIAKGNFAGGLILIIKGLANVIIGIINMMIDGINATLYPIKAIMVGIGKVLGKSWTMNNIKIPKIRYLATGGIVNLPNKGVPVGNARAGESGAEGVIPLTDSQAMETLGSAIGRYITLNITNITQMNARTINKELKKIIGNDGFSMN